MSGKRRAQFVPSRNTTVFGMGYPLEEPERVVPLAFPDKFRSSHTWCFGTTGSGKTGLLRGIVEQDIRKGHNLVILDPKGDTDLFSNVVEIAFSAKRFQDVMLFSPIFPEHSVKINPIEYFAMVEEVVGTLTSGVTVGKEPYYFNVAYELSLLITQALVLLAEAEGKPPVFNMARIRDMVPRATLEQLRTKVEYIQTEEAQRLSRTMAAVLAKPPDYFAKISNSLTVALNELSEGNIGQVLGRAHGNPLIRRLEEGRGVILVAQLGAMLAQRAAYTAGKVLLSMLQTYLGRRFASGEQLSPPLAVHIDEAQNVLYPRIQELFAKSRSGNVFLHAYCQSIGQLVNELGRDGAQAILDCCNTRAYMRVSDYDTADYVSAHLGEKLVCLPMVSMGRNNITLRDDKQARVEPQELLNLPPREMFVTTYSGTFRGKTRELAAPRLHVQFPKVEPRGVA